MENLLMILEIQKSLKRLEISKDWLRWEKRVERNLTHKLRELFKITFDRTILKLQQMITVPSNDMQRKQLLFEIDSLREKFKQIISIAAVESVNIGRQRTVSLVDSTIVKKSMFFENLIVKQATVETAFTEFSKQFEKLIRESVFVASEATMDRMIGDVMENLADSYVKGLGVGETAERLKAVFGSMEKYRLQRIARTEVLSYQNLGSHHTCIDLGVQYEQWWSARDLRVRDSHVYLHGQIVRTGDRFSNGLMFPGDRDGPASEWMQCRCRLVPFLMPFGYMAPIGIPYFYETDLVESGLVELAEPEFERGHFEESMSIGEAEKILQNDALKQGIKLSEKKAMDQVYQVGKFSEAGYRDIRSAQREILAGEEPSLLFKKDIVERMENVEDFIKYSPNYPKNEVIFRGMNIDLVSKENRAAVEMLKIARGGDIINMAGTSSWTSDARIIRKFSSSGDNAISFVLVDGSKSSASVRHIARLTEENEILISVSSKFEVMQNPVYGTLDYVLSEREIRQVLDQVYPGFTPPSIKDFIQDRVGSRWWILVKEI